MVACHRTTPNWRSRFLVSPIACRRSIAGLLAAVAALASATEPKPPSRASVAQASRAKHATRRFEHRAYTIRFPVDWYPAKFDPADGQHKRDPNVEAAQLAEDGQATFADGHGNHFAVYVDQAGDFDADAVWLLGPASDGRGVILAAEGSMCQKSAPQSDAESEEPCPAGDNRLSLGAPAIEIRGHYFSFLFGNTKKEHGVPLQVFRDIIRSFKAK